MDEARWQFAETGGGTEDGIHNPLIEHFEGNYSYHLAREIIQNALDARNDYNKPVKVCYCLRYFKPEEFPGRNQLETIIQRCYEYWSDDEVAQNKMKLALKCIKLDKIPVLKISDYNTKGLEGGDNDKKKPWYNLVKSRGSSPKTEGEGGSFGLGKGAPYAASVLRTLFYASKSEKDKKSRFIGIAELVSHIFESKVRRGSGSYGLVNQSTIFDQILMGDFWRKESGLDIYITGFKNDKGWKEELIKSILRNFWYAVLNEDLIVQVEDQEISFSSLPILMSNNFADEPFKDYVEPRGNPLNYFDAFLNGVPFKGKLSYLGNVKFHFKQTEEKLNYVAMMRKSHMVIFSKSFHFPVPFAGVFICDDDLGNEELRKMEPPTHDKWDPARHPSHGEKIMTELEEWIRKCLKEVREKRENEILEIPDLYKYLPFDEGDESGGGKGQSVYTGEESEEETSQLIGESQIFAISSSIDPYNVTILNRKELGFMGGSTAVRSGSKKLKRKKKAPRGGEGTHKALDPDEVSIRIFNISKNYGNQEFKLKILGKVNKRCDLKFKASGEDGSEKVKIIGISDSRGLNYKFTNNVIKGFYLEENKEHTLKIKLENKLRCSLIMEAYEVQ